MHSYNFFLRDLNNSFGGINRLVTLTVIYEQHFPIPHYCLMFWVWKDASLYSWIFFYNTSLNEMGGACGANGGGERCIQGSGGET